MQILTAYAIRRGAGGAVEARLHMGNPTDPTRPRSTEAPPFPESCIKTLCIFCFYNPGQPYEVRFITIIPLIKLAITLSCTLMTTSQTQYVVPIQTVKNLAQFCIVVCTMNYAAYKHNYDIFRRRDR